MRGLKILGAVMFLYGAVMLVLLFSPWKSWALDHSIAEVVSYTDRRVDNQVNGSVDDPLAYAGSAVLMFAGLWFFFVVPRAIKKAYGSAGAQLPGTDLAGGPPPGGPGSPPPPPPPPPPPGPV